MILQFQTGCIPSFEYKQYSIWDDLSSILTLFAFLILYIACSYCLMRGLKLTVQRLKKYFNKEKLILKIIRHILSLHIYKFAEKYFKT